MYSAVQAQHCCTKRSTVESTVVLLRCVQEKLFELSEEVVLYTQLFVVSIALFHYTSCIVTVGLSNTVQLRLLGNYSGILKLLESTLCCLRVVRHFFLFSFSCYASFPDVTKACYSTSVCQALQNQTYTKTLASFISYNWFFDV